MRRYANTTFLWLLLVPWFTVPVINALALPLLEVEHIGYRAWEVMTWDAGPGPFRANAVFEDEVYGDLAYMLGVRRYRQPRPQRFSTDAHGFRNPQYPPGTRFPIVVAGDSDMAGSGLSDDQSFSAQLGATLGVPVYNYAPRSPAAFLQDPRFRDAPPEILIWGKVERELSGSSLGRYLAFPPDRPLPAALPPELVTETDAAGAAAETSDPRAALRLADRLAHRRSLPQLVDYWAQRLYKEGRWYLTGTPQGGVGHVDQDAGWLFFGPALETQRLSPEERGLELTLKGIARVHALCAYHGIRLVVIPVPDKENILRDRLPARLRPEADAPDFLQELVAGLRARGVPTVELAPTFRKQWAQGREIYLRDDTHWNAAGVATAVAQTAELLRTLGAPATTPAAAP